MPDSLRRIRRLSAVLHLACYAGLAGLMIIPVLLVASPMLTTDLALARFGSIFDAPPVAWQHLGLVGCAMVALAGLALALWHLSRLFAQYRLGHVLTDGAAGSLRRLGAALIAAAPLSVLAETGAVLVLTAQNAPGTRQLSVALSSDHYALLLFGGVFVVIGWAMHEASLAAAENRSFV